MQRDGKDGLNIPLIPKVVDNDPFDRSLGAASRLPLAVVPAHHKRSVTRRGGKGTRLAVGRIGHLGVLRRLPDAQGIALHTAPTQQAISAHQMSHYQRPLV